MKLLKTHKAQGLSLRLIKTKDGAQVIERRGKTGKQTYTCTEFSSLSDALARFNEVKRE